VSNKREVVRVKIYNKGRRSWPLRDSEENKTCKPGSFITLNEDHADKLIKDYPRDFIKSDEVKKASSTKKLEADNKKLSGEVGTLTADKEKLEEDNKKLTSENEKFEADNKKLVKEIADLKAVKAGK